MPENPKPQGGKNVYPSQVSDQLFLKDCFETIVFCLPSPDLQPTTLGVNVNLPLAQSLGRQGWKKEADQITDRHIEIYLLGNYDSQEKAAQAAFPEIEKWRSEHSDFAMLAPRTKTAILKRLGRQIRPDRRATYRNGQSQDQIYTIHDGDTQIFKQDRGEHLKVKSYDYQSTKLGRQLLSDLTTLNVHISLFDASWKMFTLSEVSGGKDKKGSEWAR